MHPDASATGPLGAADLAKLLTQETPLVFALDTYQASNDLQPGKSS